MNKKPLLILVLALLLVVPLVQAGELFDFFYTTFSGTEVSQFYNDYQGWIEFAIYLAIFISLTLGVFKERFGGKQTRTISIAIGIALSFSLVQFQPGLISRLGPFAFLIFIALFWYLIFSSLKESFKDEWLTMAVSYLFSFVLLWVLDPQGQVKALVLSNPNISWITDLIIIFSVIAAVIAIVKMKEKYFP